MNAGLIDLIGSVAAVLRYVWSCAQGGVRMCVRACVHVLV